MTHASSERTLVFVCQGPSCGERGGHALLERLREWIGSSEARLHLRTCASSCLDHCATGPNVAVQSERGVRTGLVDERAAERLFCDLFADGPPVSGPTRG